MAVLGDLLFYDRNGPDLDAYLRHRSTAQVEDVVRQLPEKTFETKTDDEIVADIVSQLSVAPLKLMMESARSEVTEASVEVHDTFSRGAVRVNGVRATKTIPFTGMRELWRMRPNPYDMNPPRASVRSGALELGIEVRAGQDDAVTEHMKSTLASVGEYIGLQVAQIAAFNSALPPVVLRSVSARRARVDAAQALKNKF